MVVLFLILVGTRMRQGLDSINMVDNFHDCQHFWLRSRRPSCRYVRKESSLLYVSVHYDGLQPSHLLLCKLGHVCCRQSLCWHWCLIFPHNPIQLSFRIHALALEIMVHWLSILAHTRLRDGSNSLAVKRLAEFSSSYSSFMSAFLCGVVVSSLLI